MISAAQVGLHTSLADQYHVETKDNFKYNILTLPTSYKNSHHMQLTVLIMESYLSHELTKVDSSLTSQSIMSARILQTLFVC